MSTDFDSASTSDLSPGALQFSEHPGRPPSPVVTVVVPTRHEAENVEELVDRLDRALAGRPAEILFVDDSDDETPEVIRNVSSTRARPVRLLHRERGRRDGGLGGAVVAGFQLARAPWAIVIDADLQHPPEVVAEILDRIEEDRFDLVYGSRYTDQGSSAGLSSGFRQLASRATTLVAKAVFPRRLREISDPMSGLFAVRLSALDLGTLKPNGYKILLEIIAASHLGDAVSVPYQFQPRRAGESKAGLREGLRFAGQLLASRFGLSAARLGRVLGFMLVGVSGVAVNTGVLWALTESWAQVPYLAASVLATNVAIAWNFVLLRAFVFRSTAADRSWRAFGRFWLLNQILLPVQLLLLALFVEVVGVEALPANVLTLGIVFVLRFVASSTWVFGAASRPRRRVGRHARPRLAAPAPTVNHAVTPPDDVEKYHYLAGPQHRWFFWAHALAFVGIAISLYGFARMSYWTLILLVPLAIYLFELALGLRSSTFRRTISMIDHQAQTELRDDRHWPSVDVFLPTAGEPLDILANTYGYVSALDYGGRLQVHVLDDAGRPQVEKLAAEYGFNYLARPGSAFKKAGNLQYAFERTNGDHIIIFDADFVPRTDFASELIPYMDDERVGIVQSPQTFATDRSMHWLERSAGATQEMFYRFIQPSRNAVGAAICVGTSAIYRRAALTAIGGFPQIAHSEDVYTGFEMAKVGYRLEYVPLCVSRGICPDNIDSYISQQYRWCEGSMEMLRSADFHRDESLSVDQRISFWSGFVYYASTAMNAFFAPLPALLMFWVFPDQVRVANYIPLLGLVVLWFLLYPILMKGRWRIDVLRVQAIYGFTHAVAIWDVFFGKQSEWVPSHGSGRAKPTALAVRVRLLIVGYVGVTQAAIFAGIVVHLAEPGGYSLLNWSAAIAFAVMNAFVFLPVWWASLQEFLPAPAAEHRPTVAELAVAIGADR